MPMSWAARRIAGRDKRLYRVPWTYVHTCIVGVGVNTGNSFRCLTNTYLGVVMLQKPNQCFYGVVRTTAE